MDEEEYQRPPSFDLDGAFDQDDTSIQAIADEFEWESWRDIIANTDVADFENLRPGEYFSAADAIREAYERGILDFSEIYYDGEAWFLIVTYTED